MDKPQLTYKAVDGHLGEQLQLLREQRGFSAAAIGREIGTTYQQVRKYESGQNRISAATLFRLSEILEVDVSEFFKGLSEQAQPGQAEVAFGAVPSAELDSALDGIEDAEVRRHLDGLLQALGSRSSPAS